MREQWRDWLANLEVDGAVLDLHNDIVIELSVKAFEEIDSGVGTIGMPIGLV